MIRRPRSAPGSIRRRTRSRGRRSSPGRGRSIEPGTIVVRRGVIEAVGPDKDVTVPYDAETIDGKGLVVYPGFIDLYTTIGQRAGVERSATGQGPAGRPGRGAPGLDAARQPQGLDAGVRGRRRARADRRAWPSRDGGWGSPTCSSAPAGAIATGQSALVSLSGLPRREAIVAAPVALHITSRLRPSRPAPRPRTDAPQPGPAPGQGRRRMVGAESGPSENPYPRVLMGSIAHLRQAMLDAEHHQKLDAYYETHGGTRPAVRPGARRPSTPPGPRRCPSGGRRTPATRSTGRSTWPTSSAPTAVIVGGREAAKVADRLKADKVPVVLRLNFPEEPRVPTEAEYRKKAAAERDEPLRVLADRKAQVEGTGRRRRPPSPRRASRSPSPPTGIDRLETVPGQRPPAHHRRAAGRRRPGRAHQPRRRPSPGVDRRLGTLEPGKLGHLIVMTGPVHRREGQGQATS